MGPYNRKILDKILDFIHNDACELAVQTWVEYRQRASHTCNSCHYPDGKQAHSCAMCLESKLRTLSLYHHSDDHFENQLVHAARKLNQFKPQSSDVT
jgi:hypothetical protein